MRNNTISVSVTFSRAIDAQIEDLKDHFGFKNRSDVLEDCVAAVWGAVHSDEILKSLRVAQTKRLARENQKGVPVFV